MIHELQQVYLFLSLKIGRAKFDIQYTALTLCELQIIFTGNCLQVLFSQHLYLYLLRLLWHIVISMKRKFIIFFTTVRIYCHLDFTNQMCVLRFLCQKNRKIAVFLHCANTFNVYYTGTICNFVTIHYHKFISSSFGHLRTVFSLEILPQSLICFKRGISHDNRIGSDILNTKKKSI